MASAKDLMLPHLKECEAAAYGTKTGVTPIAKLNLNEYQYDLSPKVVETLKRQAALGKFYVYLGDEPTADLQKKVADYAGVDPENIVLDEALDQAFNRLPRLFISKGDNIVSMSPTYPELNLGVKRAGGEIKKVKMEEPDFTIDPDRMLETIDKKTKLIFICNPNNPTSTKSQRGDILKVVENAKDCVVVVDECYYEYCQETVADVVNDYENLYVARSFSKGFGLAGTRMAYLIGSKDACEVYGKILNGFEFNRFGVFAAMASLEDLAYYKGIWKIIAAEKSRIKKELEKMGIKVWPSATSFTFMDVSSTGKTSTEIKNLFLDEYGVLIRDVFATFPEMDKKYISFGTGKPKINDLLINGFRKCSS